MIKLYKGVLGSVFGDLGPFSSASASHRSGGAASSSGPRLAFLLTLDGEDLPARTWSAVVVLNGDLGHDFPLGRGLPLAASRSG